MKARDYVIGGLCLLTTGCASLTPPKYIMKKTQEVILFEDYGHGEKIHCEKHAANKLINYYDLIERVTGIIPSTEVRRDISKHLMNEKSIITEKRLDKEIEKIQEIEKAKKCDYIKEIEILNSEAIKKEKIEIEIIGKDK